MVKAQSPCWVMICNKLYWYFASKEEHARTFHITRIERLRDLLMHDFLKTRIKGELFMNFLITYILV